MPFWNRSSTSAAGLADGLGLAGAEVVVVVEAVRELGGAAVRGRRVPTGSVRPVWPGWLGHG
jgi:hypothetical protein